MRRVTFRRSFTRKQPPTKAALRVDALQIVLHRLDDMTPELIAKVARTHKMSAADLERMIADEKRRRCA